MAEEQVQQTTEQTQATEQSQQQATESQQPEQVQSEQTQQAQPSGAGTVPDQADVMNFFAQMIAQQGFQQQQQQVEQPQPQDSEAQAQGEGTTSEQETEQVDPFEQVPETWDKYEVPQGMDVPDPIKQMAHQHGMNQRQFQAALQTFATYQQAQALAEKKALENLGQQFIQQEWGDRAEYELNLARRALKAVDKDGELSQFLNDTGYGNHPLIIKIFNRLGKDLQEGGFLRADTTPKKEKELAELLYPSMKK